MIPARQLASPEYIEMQRVLHTRGVPYGERGDKWTKTVIAVAEAYEASSILDYGCGQGSLGKRLRNDPRFDVREYDPAIQGKDSSPGFADLVVCTDVLEHVEPDCLDAVLKHLRLLSRKALFIVVAICDTANVLTDGRNAHLIVRPANWWKKRMEASGFTLRRAPSVARRKKSHEWRVVLEP